MRPRREQRRRRKPAPVGVVLAGGAGRRIGGSKAIVNLGGRPLISYPLQAVWRGLGNAAVVAKLASELPDLPGLTVWIEPDEPRHPLVGIVHALELADGSPVLVCAGDLPFVTPELVRELAQADPRGAPAVVAGGKQGIQPLLGCYQPQARALLAPWAGAPADEVRLTGLVTQVGARVLRVEDEEALFNVNSPDDLLLAAAMLDRGGAASRT